MDPAFEQAAFALEPGDGERPRSQPLRIPPHRGHGIEGGEPMPFDDVRDQLAAELSSGEAEAAYFELAEQLANLTYESPDSLVPAAETLDLEVQTSDWITRDAVGGEGPLAQTRVIAAAFSEDVLVRGNNSELLEPDPEQMQAIVLRVDEHEPAASRPLDEVRDEIVEVLRELLTVLAVEDGELGELDASVRDAERRMLSRGMGNHGFEAVLDDLVARAKIERRALSSDEDAP
jgi:peptidyl-prolyl cis-trans isomerase D